MYLYLSKEGRTNHKSLNLQPIKCTYTAGTSLLTNMYHCACGQGQTGTYVLLIISERYPQPLVLLSPLYCVWCGEEVRHKLLVALIHHAPGERGRRRNGSLQQTTHNCFRFCRWRFATQLLRCTVLSYQVGLQ